MSYMKKKLDLSLVIACYNEEPHLEKNINEVVNVLDQTRLEYEIIFVDDCSKDNTREVIDRLLSAYPGHNMTKLFHEQNKGRGGTVTDGFRIASGEVAGYIDIDLEVHARYIPSMLQAIEGGADIAVALRIYKFYFRSIDRYILSKGYAWLVKKILDLPFNDTETGYKFFRRDLIMPLIEEIDDEHWFWDTEFMSRAHIAGFKVAEIPCLFIRQWDKVSTVNPITDSIEYFIKLFRYRMKQSSIRKKY